MCGRPITAQTREQISPRILALPEGTRFLVLAPVIRGQKGEYKDLFADMLKRGFVRARVDGQVVRLTDDLQLDRRIKHNIEIVIDRLKNDANSAAASGGSGRAGAWVWRRARSSSPLKRPRRMQRRSKRTRKRRTRPTKTFSSPPLCLHACNRSYEPPSPQLFSFNSPHGMCPDCDGLGTRYTFDAGSAHSRSDFEFFMGRIPLVGKLRGMGRWRRHIYEGVAKTLDIDLKTPWRRLAEANSSDLLLYGSGDRHITFEWKQRGGGVWKHGGKWEGSSRRC